MVLTKREIEILELLSKDLTSKQIGEKLGISKRTCETHLQSIYKKMDLRMSNRDRAVIRYRTIKKIGGEIGKDNQGYRSAANKGRQERQ